MNSDPNLKYLHRLKSCTREAFRSERGNAMVELAIALPILLLFAVGAADYVRVYRTGIVVTNAARAGADYGALSIATPGTGTATAQMIAGAKAEAGTDTVGVFSVNALQYCFCPGSGTGTGVVDCTTVTSCPGTYGTPQVFDSVRITKAVPMTIHYLALPDTITVARSVVLREQ